MSTCTSSPGACFSQRILIGLRTGSPVVWSRCANLGHPAADQNAFDGATGNAQVVADSVWSPLAVESQGNDAVFALAAQSCRVMLGARRAVIEGILGVGQEDLRARW